MRVFISSVITGFVEQRKAAALAVTSLGHTPLRAEDRGATTTTPQRACLEDVRSCDVFALILGGRYGPVQSSDLSATHEEYREARERKPVLVFVQEGVSMEPLQEKFLAEIRSWEGGHLYEGFADAEGLRAAVTQAIHRHELSSTAGTVSADDLQDRATSILPDRSDRGPCLVLALGAGPRQTVLRASELEDEVLHRDLLAQCLTGPDAVLDPAIGVHIDSGRSMLTIREKTGVAVVRLTAEGTIGIAQSPLKPRDRRGVLPVLIEEFVRERLTRGLRLAGTVLDRVDGLHRLSHVSVVGCLLGADGHAWRTQAEQDRSPNSMEISLCRPRILVHPQPALRRRAALLMQPEQLADDIAALLKREMREHS